MLLCIYCFRFLSYAIFHPPTITWNCWHAQSPVLSHPLCHCLSPVLICYFVISIISCYFRLNSFGCCCLLHSAAYFSHPLAILSTRLCARDLPHGPHRGWQCPGSLPFVLCLRPSACGSCAGDLAALPRARALRRWAPVLTRRVQYNLL